jgi:hypothetical protein
MHIFGRLIQPPLSAFVDGSFMELAVAPPCGLSHVDCIQWNSFWISANASRACRMFFLQASGLIANLLWVD